MKELHLGDCLEVLKTLAPDSVDALVTDPPAGIGFMGVAWDSYSTPKGGARSGDDWDWTGSKERPRTAQVQQRVIAKQGRAFRAFLTAVAEECYRVLKPGAHGLVWAIPRTSHWTATALEDAGFEVRDFVCHHFGSGFPKSLDVSKAIDKMAGAEREVVGSKYGQPGYSLVPNKGHLYGGGFGGSETSDPEREAAITAPATEAAKQWQGWGTALKPATEVWWLIRKPLAEPNVASQVLATGTGAINVDGCRVPGIPEATRFDPSKHSHDGWRMKATGAEVAANASPSGRWPANLVLSHSPDCRPLGVRKVRSGVAGPKSGGIGGGMFGDGIPDLIGGTYADPDGTEQVAAYECVEGCPVAELDRQSGESVSTGGRIGNKDGGHIYGGGAGLAGEYRAGDPGFGDRGGASRFFYTAKASSSERSAGLHRPGDRNGHPTVKPVDLMRWLCRLITPPGGTVLDPFMGSGSTGVAAELEGFEFIGIEKDAESFETARKRLGWAVHEPGLFDEEVIT